MKKVITICVVIAILAGGGCYFYKKKQTEEAAKTAAAEQTIVKVKKGAIRQSVHCTGKMVSNLDVDIKCKASGQVVKLPFDVSDHVMKGDQIVEIDPVDQSRLVQQAEATLAISQAKYESAQANLMVAERNLAAEKLRAQALTKASAAKVADTSSKARREKELFNRKQASQEEVETAQTTAIQAAADQHTAEAQVESTKALEAQLEARRQDIKLAKAQMESDKIALAIASQRLSETKIMSPIEGYVAARPIQIGTIIASGINNVGGGTTILTLSDLSRIFILASVDESDIGNVQLGQKVEITADSYQRKLFTGKVNRIATKGVNVSNVVTFEVRVEVDSENKKLLKPEMTANVEIIVADKSDILTVPSTAITRSKDKTFVTIKKTDTAKDEQIPVEIGISDGNETEIVSGINENDSIVMRKNDADSKWKAANQRPTGGPSIFRPSGGGRK